MIREATATDQKTIRRMVRQARLDPTGLHWSHFMVAEREGRIVGIGQIRPAAAELGSLVVLPGWQQQGIGAALVTALVARHSGTLYLECERKMVPYYERFAFEEVRPADVPPLLRIKNSVPRLLGFDVAVMRREASDE